MNIVESDGNEVWKSKIIDEKAIFIDNFGEFQNRGGFGEFC